MSVSNNAVGTVQTGTGVSSLNYTGITVGTGANRALIVTVALTAGTTGLAVTWNGVSMTQLGIATGGNSDLYMFGLAAPATGNLTAAVSWTGSANVGVCATSWFGVRQANSFINVTALNSQASSASGSIPITTDSSSAVQALFAQGGGLGAGNVSTVDHTQVYIEGVITGTGSNYSLGSGTSVTLGCTFSATNIWAALGVDIVSSPITVFSRDFDNDSILVHRFIHDPNR